MKTNFPFNENIDMMGPQERELYDSLIAQNTKKFFITLGEKPATPEQLAEQVNIAMREIAEGRATYIDNVDAPRSNQPKINVKDII
jgi:hypothetical protein